MTATVERPDDGPILPMWARDRATFHAALRVGARRTLRRVSRLLVHLPTLAWWLVVVYPWRGLWRVTARVSRYLYDHDSAVLRHEHAGRVETSEYRAAHAVRKANLKARWLVASAVVLPVAVPVLAWTYPRQLSAAAGLVVAWWIVKAIPGRGLGELVVAAGVGSVVAWTGPGVLEHIPRPHPAVTVLVLAGAWVGLGWLGRPIDKTLIPAGTLAAGTVAPPLKAALVRDALCGLGIGGMRDPEQIRLLQEPHRHGPGVQIDLDLPVAAAEVVKRREQLAARLKRELGCVWPSVGAIHAAHLSLFVADVPMLRQVQRDWPLAKSERVDVFRPVPFVTDKRGEWLPVTLAYTSWVIGAVPRVGKTFLLRQALLVAGLDPRTRVYCLDGKGTGDLKPCRLFAHFHSSGPRAAEVEDRVLPMLRGLHAELDRRAEFINTLPFDEVPESKVTSELVDRYPHLAPIVIGMDESQSYLGYGNPKDKRHKAVRDEITAIVTDLVKLGPALGYITLLATQNVCEQTIPRHISLNAVIRFALKLFDHTANDQVLGTGAYSRGVDATVFDSEDKGIAIMRAEGVEPQVVRTVVGLDAIAAELLAARARASRVRAGLLTGEATDEVMDDEADQVVLLDDVRKVFIGATAMHLTDLVDALAELRPDLYGHLDAVSLGKLLRAAGVVVDNVYVAGKPRDESSRKGVKREWLDVSATEVIGDPEDDE